MVKMQLRLDQEQVATIQRALHEASVRQAGTDFGTHARWIHSWLEWRSEKLWGAQHDGELDREVAS